MRKETYPTTTIASSSGYRFLFESTGPSTEGNEPRIIAKAVDYDYLRLESQAWGVSVYNLGFGDLDPASGQILDDSEANNGDAYRVFYTVLATVERFFQLNPEAYIMVGGSDDQPDFIRKCRESCRKNCKESCKNQGQRMRVYAAFVSKELVNLSAEFKFWGLEYESEEFEAFTTGKRYAAILCRKIPAAT